ncbi:hypothetical protein ACFLU6_13695 [Acidobacteriota bacterium]
MGFAEKVTRPLRLWYHKKEIQRSLAEFRNVTGRSGEKLQDYSDSGTFRSQVERLFSVGNAQETGELQRIATSAVYCCLSSRYYKPADFLSDILQAMENRTYLSLEPDGEPPLSECDEVMRRIKLDLIIKFYLVPVKVAAMETILRYYVKVIGRKLPYQSFSRFERRLARLFGVLGESETTFMENEVMGLINRWWSDPAIRHRFHEPAAAFEPIMKVLLGQESIDIASTLRLRKPGVPLRIGTLVPEDRQHLLRYALAKTR